MNIKLSYDFNLPQFKTLFPEISLYDPNKDSDSEIDLLIFPGGSDVSLEFYMDDANIEELAELCNTDRKRDDYELKILENAMKPDSKIKKILGICRGVQFLNVMFGGSLYADLNRYGFAHEGVHEVIHVNPSNLEFIKYVNSLHHQGIRELGYTFRTPKVYVKLSRYLIASDARDIVPEIVSWQNGRILGFQFHPEYYNNSSQEKEQIKSFLYGWISGNRLIY